MIAYCLLQAYYIIQSFTLKTVTIIIFKFYVYNKMLKGMTKIFNTFVRFTYFLK